MKNLITIILFFITTFFTFAQNSIDSGLVAFYPFNGNTNDVSGNENNGSSTNAVLTYDRFGIDQKAYYFNGTNARIEIPGSSSLNISDEITISAWIKPEVIQTSGNRMVLGKSNYSNATNYIFRIVPNGYIQWEYAPSLYTISNPLTANTWYHVVLTSDSTNGLKQIFINGDLIVSQVLSGSGSFGNVTNPLTIGAAYYFGSSWAEFFKGAIDDIRIYNRVLDSLEVVELFNDSTTNYSVTVQSVYPDQNSSYFLPDETIKAFFNETIDPATVNSSSVFVKGNLTGGYQLEPVYYSGNNSIEITPLSPFKVGEEIMVSVTSEILDTAGNPIVPFVFTFKVKPQEGSAKFVVADSLQLDFSPTQITSADLNNDGLIDVVASSYDSAKVIIALNQGNGLFTASTLISGDFMPSHCAISDIDNYLGVDLIFPATEQNKIYLYKNDGAGNFAYFNELDVTGVVAVCTGDFDGGGNTDLVALTNQGTGDSRAISFWNDGQGNFSEGSDISVSYPIALRNVVGDIDNDGDLDIIGGTSEYWGVFKILKNNGYGDFIFVDGPYLGPHPDELAGADLDGDYDLDFVKCDWYQNGVGIAINNGLGEYPVENFLNLGNVGGQTRNPVVNDFDGDGDLDFVGAYNSNNLGIVKNNGYPNFEFYLSYPMNGLKGITAADFDNNGSVDLVGISSTTNQIKFLKNCVDSLVSYYPFDGNTRDQSGNINDGINYNGLFVQDRYGVNDAAMYFDSLTSYVEGRNPGNNLPIGNSQRTFTAWIKALSYDDYGNNIFHYGTAQAAPTNFHFLIKQSVGMGNGYGFGVLYGNANVVDSTWHFIGGVYEGGTERVTKLYVNGNLDVISSITSEPNTILGSNWRIGRFMEGDVRFNGSIDELKVFDFALTDQQIWDMYKATTTAPTLLFPGNDSTLINPINLVFDWDSTVTSNYYRLLIASDSLFLSAYVDTIISQSFYPITSFEFTDLDNIYWKVRTINDGGIGPWSDVNNFSIILTDVEEEQQLPTEFALLQNYPNPFNPFTIISYELPKASKVEIKVYDIIGNEIVTLVDEYKSAGSYNVEFRIKNDELSSGIYFYQLKAVNPSTGSEQSFIQTKKMAIIK